jgi:hypothetical protein
VKSDWESIFQGLERKPKDEDGPDFPGGVEPRNREHYKSRRAPLDLEHVSFRLAELPDGTQVRLYPIGSLAKVLGRQTATIRSWEKKGWLPSPKYRSQAPIAPRLPGKAVKGDRLYTEAQMRFLIDAVNRFNLDSRMTSDWDGFRNNIALHYPHTFTESTSS